MRWLIYMIFPLFLIVPAAFAEEEAVVETALEEQPVTVSADRLEADDTAHTVTFHGNVVVRQADITLYAAEVTVFYYGGEREIERTEAQGDVRVVQGDRIATGERAHFYNDEKRIVLSGAAQVRQGEDLVSGEEITVYLNEERSIVKGEEGSRVKAIFRPGGTTP
ncbi:MAG: lipopolysaccharide transport periplasmic protein LptA [Desulfuromonas sp.]|nr:MAG: lipopolysaccharide transport periplasmic protein LptA [Desulfuromonas sp.]